MSSVDIVPVTGCYVCRRSKNIPADNALIVGLTVGYAMASTRDTDEWWSPPLCERHARKFEKAAAGIRRYLRGSFS